MQPEPDEATNESNAHVLPSPLLGAHMPTTGGVHRAVLDGAAIGCSTVQLFTSSPQQWRARPITPEQAEQFQAACVETGIGPRVVHDSYLINLATADEALREKSRRAFLEEMDRCEALGIDFLVTHCGACGTEPEDEGLGRLIASLSTIHRATAGYHTAITLEVTAGQGSCLGYRFEHFRRVLDEIEEVERLRLCLDTCHAFAAGYDLRTSDDYYRTLDAFDAIVGIRHLAVLHLNDSRRELGSRVDRHDHIGKGHIGPEAFRLILKDRRLSHIPKIVETPSFKLHQRNMELLRYLATCDHPVCVRRPDEGSVPPDAEDVTLRLVTDDGKEDA